MSRCIDCEHNSCTSSDWENYCMQCAELNDEVDELHYKKRIINNASVIVICTYAGKGCGSECTYAAFSSREEDKKFGRDQYCQYADNWCEITYCTNDEACAAARKEANE